LGKLVRVGFEFGLLGALTVAWDGIRVPIAAARQRALLAYLLVNANQVVTAENLINGIWGSGHSRGGSRNDLQNLVSRLRRTLSGPGRTVPLLTRPGGYLIEVAEDAVDVSRFRDAVGRARAVPDPEQAARLLRSTLALWRGSALADVPSEQLHRDLVPVWEEERLTAVELCLDAEIRADRHREITGELRELTTRHPLRERFWTQRMLALYRSGRSAEALDCYRALSNLLADELGVDPSPAVRDLHLQILRGHPDLRTEIGRTETTTGQRQEPVPRQLPATIADFSGRAEEAGLLRELLTLGRRAMAGTRIATIAGMGGVGKTTLAVHLAQEVVLEFPDGQLFADLQRAGQPVPPGEILADFMRALGACGSTIPHGLAERASMYRSLLAARRILVVLDNAVSEAQVRPLLPGAASCGVIITSRRRLTGLAGTRPLDLGMFPENSAVEFLGQAIGAGRITAEPGAARDLVRSCGALPLALRTVAARLLSRPYWRLADLALRLRNAHHPLDELTHREFNVRATIASSYSGLPLTARTMLRRIGLPDHADFAVEAAARLLDVEPGRAQDLLEHLVDAKLLEVVEHAFPDRFQYRCHRLIHAYARERALAEDGPDERLAALARAAHHPQPTAGAPAGDASSFFRRDSP
jgi:DNA-binding SARP family transcriptional activator